MKKILMLLDGKYPQDIRVRKEAEELVKLGFTVKVVVPKADENQKSKETVNGVQVERIGASYSTKKRGIYDIINYSFCYHPLFSKYLKKEDLSKWDFVHVHDLPLSHSVRKIVHKRGKRIILDMHENYPEGIETWFSWRKGAMIRLKNRLFFNPKKWRKIEKRECEKVDHIIAVVDEMKNRLVELYNIDAAKITVISNYEYSNFKFEESGDGEDKEFSILYIGGIGPHRGIQTAIAGLSILKKEGVKLRFDIVGSGQSDTVERLKAQVSELGLEEQVIFHGQVPFEKVKVFIANASLNIIPHLSNNHTDHTIPHKLFQILLSKKLLMVSSCKPLKRIVKENECGYIFEAGDAGSFAETINLVLRDESNWDEKMERGYKACIENKMTWEAESQKLAETLNRI